ncbi:hypothetical protein Hypma_012191 [Hypsizygus marmoreus]|uniref:Prolyl 4-hydroxylase alpha subunit Fe(2+) 2OG dioxygenase domain-containing protein n=1 Tax=Hypsizygus marmoreus TaxID=39966 RepID=A0A369JMF5_HYPMA|nr:hypothetical protein Hypma_012191 [Hypsizygus marmoreus]
MSEISNKRPRSRSDEQRTSTSDEAAQFKAANDIPESQEPPEKKPKEDDGVSIPTVHLTEAMAREMRSGFDLNLAITRVTSLYERINSIGHCLTRYEEGNPPSDEQQEVLDALRNVYEDFPRPYCHGAFDTDLFHLKITRHGCEFDGDLSTYETSTNTIRNRLRTWYENAAISGYGDMKALETKVDFQVRDAREILASDFTVDSGILDLVRSTWAERFTPREVRVSPYKIHIYGPGGHFKSHRDTPEHGLVGTFLIGLGDTRLYSEAVHGKFLIGEEALSADVLSWVAFHPDVPHSVSKMEENQYRAVIAFKLFNEGQPDEHEAAYRELELQKRTEAILSKIPPPYGILLDHKYPMGVLQLNGFDAILLAAARRQQGTDVHVLPVLIQTSSDVYDDEDTENEDRFYTYILPFTSAHVDFILGKDDISDAKEKVKFFEDIEDVPFYSRDFKQTTFRWQTEERDINYTGNESDGTSENSIYLSYALLVLPMAIKSKDSDCGCSDD